MLSTLRLVLLLFIAIPFLVHSSFAQCPGNVISNPGFENGETAWFIQGDASISTDAFSGSGALEIGLDGSRIYQTHPASPGQIFTLDAFWKKLDFFGDANLGFKFLTGAYVPLEFHLATLDVVSDFVNIETIVATAPPQTAFIEITAHSNASSSAIIVDDFCLTVEGNGSGQKPDLVLTNLRAEEVVAAGGDWDLTFDLGNIGAITAFGAIEVGIYISTDQLLSSDDNMFGTETYSNIPVGGEDDLTALLTLPSILSNGDYFVILKVDNQEVLNEENENNNTNLKALEIGTGGTNPTPCAIEAAVITSSINCNDNNSPTNPLDDLWSFDIRPINTANANANGWRAHAGGINFSGEYGETFTMSGFLIANGAIDIIIEDENNASCTKMIVGQAPPAPCSNMPPTPCEIEASILPGSITCFNNNTPNNNFDDLWSFDIRPTNINPDALGWRSEFNGLTFTGAYNVTRTLSGFSIADGAIEVKIEDQTDPDCIKNIGTVNPPATCSNVTPNPCGIQVSIIPGSITCYDHSTPNNPNDDFWAFAIRPTNSDPDADGWRADFNGLSFTGVYDVTYTLAGFIIADGPIDVKIQDRDDVNCIKTISNVVPPPACSNSTPPPAPDCDVASDFPWHDWILKVKINEEGISSGKSTYSDFTNVVFDVPTEEPNDIELTAGFSWENWDEYFRVYIDFNQDDIYGDDEIYFQGMLPAKPNGTEKNKLRVLDFNINPSDVIYGLTTMRIVMSRDAYAGPCDNIPFGEIEDYSVNVVDILDYSPWHTRENFTPEQLFVYPNPTNEFININLEDAFEKEGSLILVNAFGQVVWQKNLEDMEEDIYRLPVEKLISGQYTVFMQVDGAFPKYAKVMVIGER